MKISKKIILTLSLLGMFMISLVGCNSSQANQNATINVGMNLNNAPFCMKNNEENEGFDIDFINYLSKSLALNLKVIDTPKISLIPNLINAQTDLVISGMSYDDAMKISDDIITSESYYEVKDVVLVNSNSDKKIKTIKDLNNKVIGVKINSQQEEIINSLIKDKTLNLNQLKQYNKNTDAILDLQNGEIDAVVVDNIYIDSRDFEDIQVLSESLSKKDLVVVASKDNEELINKINIAIDSYKKSKEYKTSINNWLK